MRVRVGIRPRSGLVRLHPHPPAWHRRRSAPRGGSVDEIRRLVMSCCGGRRWVGRGAAPRRSPGSNTSVCRRCIARRGLAGGARRVLAGRTQPTGLAGHPVGGRGADRRSSAGQQGQDDGEAQPDGERAGQDSGDQPGAQGQTSNDTQRACRLVTGCHPAEAMSACAAARSQSVNRVPVRC